MSLAQGLHGTMPAASDPAIPSSAIWFKEQRGQDKKDCEGVYKEAALISLP